LAVYKAAPSMAGRKTRSGQTVFNNGRAKLLFQNPPARGGVQARRPQYQPGRRTWDPLAGSIAQGGANATGGTRGGPAIQEKTENRCPL